MASKVEAEVTDVPVEVDGAVMHLLRRKVRARRLPLPPFRVCSS